MARKTWDQQLGGTDDLPDIDWVVMRQVGTRVCDQGHKTPVFVSHCTFHDDTEAYTRKVVGSTD
jgi:hypothetical protein